MTNIIHIIPEPPNIKNNIKKVEKRIKEASDEISRAKKELNNANHSELSYEINQLESMYKKNNQYASEFESFASKVETMLNEYITADKNCANKIRSNGKSHRQKTGLPKNLSAALISSSFEKLDDIRDGIKEWVDGIIDELKDIPIIGSIIKSITEDFDSWIQIAGSLISGIICLVTIAAAPVGGPIALVTAMAAGLSYLMQLDQFMAGFADILNLWETDGDSITQNIFGDTYDEIYNLFDIGLGVVISGGLSNGIKNLKNANDLIKFETLDDFRKYFDNLTNIKTLGNMEKFLDSKGIWDTLSQAKNFIYDFILSENPEGTIDDIKDSIIENTLKGRLKTI